MKTGSCPYLANVVQHSLEPSIVNNLETVIESIETPEGSMAWIKAH